MSFSTLDSEIMYEGNNVDFTFEIPFFFQREANILAQIYDVSDPDKPVTTDLIPIQDYAIVNSTLYLKRYDIDPVSGQPVLLDRPLGDDEVLRIYRSTADTRLNDYTQYQFPAPAVNNEMDRIHQRLQELRREVDRAIKLNALQMENGESLTAEDILEAIAALEKLIADLDKGSTLPSGGEIGDFLERDVDSTATWHAGSFEGFSETLGKYITTTSLSDTLLQIMNFQYRNPIISIATTPSATVRERGVVVPLTNIRATYAKTSNTVLEVAFFRGATELSRVPVVAQSGSEDFTITEDVTTDTTYRVSAKDDTNEVFSSATFKFVYPYFYGVGAAGLAGQSILTLGKDVREATASIAFVSSPVNQRFYFCQPASYPLITSVLDQNSFETIGAYIVRLTNVTMLDGTVQSYRVYELSNDTTQTNFRNTFRR